MGTIGTNKGYELEVIAAAFLMNEVVKPWPESRLREIRLSGFDENRLETGRVPVGYSTKGPHLTHPSSNLLHPIVIFARI
jgi:hypothetical protein